MTKATRQELEALAAELESRIQYEIAACESVGRSPSILFSLDELRAILCLAAHAGEQEPVAYLYRWNVGGEILTWRVSEDRQKVPASFDGIEEIPLYLNPAPTSDGALREALESLRRAGEGYYVQYVDQIDAHCRGAGAKLSSRTFGNTDLDAHTKAHEYLGLHRGLMSAVSEINAALVAANQSDGTASAEGRVLGPDPCVGKARDIQKNVAGAAPGPSDPLSAPEAVTVEELARELLIADNYHMTASDQNWPGAVAHHEEMREAHPDYEKGRSVMTDAFRRARAILSRFDVRRR